MGTPTKEAYGNRRRYIEAISRLLESAAGWRPCAPSLGRFGRLMQERFVVKASVNGEWRLLLLAERLWDAKRTGSRLLAQLRSQGKRVDACEIWCVPPHGHAYRELILNP